MTTTDKRFTEFNRFLQTTLAPANLTRRDTRLTINEQINLLKPGHSFVTSEGPMMYCTVERSGDGKTLRFVRNYANRCEVYRSCNFE
jgi:hypothetical protein